MILSEGNRRANSFWTYADDFSFLAATLS